MRVMIVDDERMATEELYDICVSHHLINEAVTFDNPTDALVFIAQNSDVDIAFLDIEMPIMTGLDLAKRINTLSSETKIVFVTGIWQKEPISAINGAIKKLNSMGYNNAYVVTLNEYKSGGGSHPSAKEHEEIAGVLMNFFKKNGIA